MVKKRQKEERSDTIVRARARSCVGVDDKKRSVEKEGPREGIGHVRSREVGEEEEEEREEEEQGREGEEIESERKSPGSRITPRSNNNGPRIVDRLFLPAFRRLFYPSHPVLPFAIIFYLLFSFFFLFFFSFLFSLLSPLFFSFSLLRGAIERDVLANRRFLANVSASSPSTISYSSEENKFVCLIRERSTSRFRSILFHAKRIFEKKDVSYVIDTVGRPVSRKSKGINLLNVGRQKWV